MSGRLKRLDAVRVEEKRHAAHDDEWLTQQDRFDKISA